MVVVRRVLVGSPMSRDLVVTRLAACAAVPTEMGGCVVRRGGYYYVGIL